QLLGGIFAMIFIMACFPDASDSMNTLTLIPDPSINGGRVFFMEFLLTFILVFVIFTVAFEGLDEKQKSIKRFKGTYGMRGLTLYTSTPQSKVRTACVRG